MNVHVCVLKKTVGHVGVIVVRREVASAQAQLALRSGHDRGVGQTEDRGLLAVDVPVEMLPGLPDADAQKRIPEDVIAVARVSLEPVPIFGALAPVDVDQKRPHLVRGRRGWSQYVRFDGRLGNRLAGCRLGWGGALLREKRSRYEDERETQHLVVGTRCDKGRGKAQFHWTLHMRWLGKCLL